MIMTLEDLKVMFNASNVNDSCLDTFADAFWTNYAHKMY